MKDKIKRFLRNSHGMDRLSQHLYYLSIVFFVISLFTKSNILRILSLIGLFISLFRSLSQKHFKRTKEDLLYTKYYNKVVARVKVFWLNIKHFKTHKYVVCKSCNQQLRIPKKQGKVIVTCSRCRNKFEVKS
ncbi:MAG: hypothetical protein GX769_00885 [Erysipelothrix sp.]|nr:hypothetical protein [Erysipelothrix sp.]